MRFNLYTIKLTHFKCISIVFVSLVLLYFLEIFLNFIFLSSIHFLISAIMFLISNNSLLCSDCRFIIAYYSCFIDAVSSLSSLRIILVFLFHAHAYASSKFIFFVFLISHFPFRVFLKYVVSLIIYSWFIGSINAWLEAGNASIGPVDLELHLWMISVVWYGGT